MIKSLIKEVDYLLTGKILTEIADDDVSMHLTPVQAMYTSKGVCLLSIPRLLPSQGFSDAAFHPWQETKERVQCPA